MANFVFVAASGLILNRVVADDIADCSPPDGSAVVAETEGQPMTIGGTLIDGVYAPPPGPPPLPEMVPQSISDRQFFQQLAIEGRITNQEALDAVKTGAIPSALQSFVDSLSPADKFNAQMLLSGATVFQRNHPLTIAIGQAQGMSSEQVDEFFRAAAAL
jgi:hypothetical protein